jgi:hypothetical protein
MAGGASRTRWRTHTACGNAGRARGGSRKVAAVWVGAGEGNVVPAFVVVTRWGGIASGGPRGLLAVMVRRKSDRNDVVRRWEGQGDAFGRSHDTERTSRFIALAAAELASHQGARWCLMAGRCALLPELSSESSGE